MNGEPLRRKVIVTNPNGFHLRPVAAFAKLASGFQSKVTVWKDDRQVDGKSVWDLMTIVSEQGTELIVEASGSDAQSAVDALAELLALPALDDKPDPP